MNKAIVLSLILLVTLALIAQSTGPSQITLKPLAASTGCVADATGDVLCGASDGLYVSIAGGTFQKIGTGTIAPATTISCSTASLASGATGKFTASGCVLK